MNRSNSSGRGGGRHTSGRHSQNPTGRRGGQGGRSMGHRTPQGNTSPLVGKILELAVDTLALGGAGVARMPEDIEGCAGMAVFVAGALPGSRVSARLTAVHRRHAEAQVVETITPSPDAVAPFCPHFGLCGGCSLQHLSPESQLAWKERQIVDALRRIGKVEPQKVLPPIAAPMSQRFRNKMEFAFQSPPRGKEDGLRLGLYEAGSTGRVFDLVNCPIFPQAGEELVHAVRAACKAAGFAAYDRGTREGYLRHLVLRHSVHQDAFLAQLITAPGTEAQSKAVQRLGEDLLAAFPKLTGFVHAERAKPDGLAQAERTRLTLGAPTLIEALEDVRYSISADSFFQTCTRGAEALYAGLREMADIAPTETVLDLYCGGGGIALFLAGVSGRVLGLEANASAVADAQANAALAGITNCRFLRADLSDVSEETGEAAWAALLPGGEAAPRVAVVDPPREGLDAGLVQWLSGAPVPRLAYVSCNPATLARDAGLLSATYDLVSVRAVDLFPHTAHAECLALFLAKA